MDILSYSSPVVSPDWKNKLTVLIKFIMPTLLNIYIFVASFLMFQTVEPSFGIKELIGTASTPLSVAIVIIGFRWVFTAWREDTQKHREDTQQFFNTLKELVNNLADERKELLILLSKSPPP